MPLRIPFDPDYTALLGRATYVFAYYEWAVIHLIEQFRPGFLNRYCRGKPMTSGDVKRALEEIMKDSAISCMRISREELRACCISFVTLIKKRNALIHAHPITDTDGGQVLYRQARPDRPLPDMKWSKEDVEHVLYEFDAAACEANVLLHRCL